MVKDMKEKRSRWSQDQQRGEKKKSLVTRPTTGDSGKTMMQMLLTLNQSHLLLSFNWYRTSSEPALVSGIVNMPRCVAPLFFKV